MEMPRKRSLLSWRPSIQWGMISKGTFSVLNLGSPLPPHLSLNCPLTRGLDIPQPSHLTSTTELFPRPVPPTALPSQYVTSPSFPDPGWNPGVIINPSLTLHIIATLSALPSKCILNPTPSHHLCSHGPGSGCHWLLPGRHLSLLICPPCLGPYITSSSPPQLPSVQALLPTYATLTSECHCLLWGHSQHPLLRPSVLLKETPALWVVIMWNHRMSVCEASERSPGPSPSFLTEEESEDQREEELLQILK